MESAGRVLDPRDNKLVVGVEDGGGFFFFGDDFFSTLLLMLLSFFRFLLFRSITVSGGNKPISTDRDKALGMESHDRPEPGAVHFLRLRFCMQKVSNDATTVSKSCTYVYGACPAIRKSTRFGVSEGSCDFRSKYLCCRIRVVMSRMVAHRGGDNPLEWNHAHLHGLYR